MGNSHFSAASSKFCGKRRILWRGVNICVSRNTASPAYFYDIMDDIKLVSEQILNGTSAQFRLFSVSNGRWAKKLKPKGFTS